MKEKYVWVAFIQYKIDDPTICVFSAKAKAKKYVIDFMRENLRLDKWEKDEIEDEIDFFKQNGHFNLERYTAFIKKCSADLQ